MVMLSVARAPVQALSAAAASAAAEPGLERLSVEPGLKVTASASAAAPERVRARRARLAATSATTPRSVRSTSIRN
ncbi:hypothetical protein CCP2SC5_60008 [Azospirillaceae bacterium]